MMISMAHNSFKMINLFEILKGDIRRQPLLIDIKVCGNFVKFAWNGELEINQEPPITENMMKSRYGFYNVTNLM
jgi:hypothetical protein